MITEKKNIFKDKDFNNFTSQICEVVKDACEKFWEEDIKLNLHSINDFREFRDEKSIDKTDFFTSSIKVENHKPAVIRLSRDFVENFLNSALKNDKKNFIFSNLTPLEIKILNTFCEFIYKKMKDILIPPEKAKLTDKSEKNINMIFMVEAKDEIVSKIAISIAQDRIPFKVIEKKYSFKDEDFLTSSFCVRIKAGSSKVTLEELENLAIDDIVVLDNSNTTHLTLLSGEFEKKFNVKVNPSLVISLKDEENEDAKAHHDDEVKMEKNLWDDIQIEISAEFEKVKMTIGELKQITQGQIVELGSVFEGDISLFVEDRKVAKGELIIINNKYAVRLNEVLSNKEPQKKVLPQSQTLPDKTPQKTSPSPVKQSPIQRSQIHTAQQNKNDAAIKSRPIGQRQIPRSAPKGADVSPKPQAQNIRPQVEDEEFDYSDFDK